MNSYTDKQILIVKHVIEKSIGQGDLSVYEQLISEDILSHCPASWNEIHQVEIKGRDHAKRIDEEYASAFHFISPVSIDECIPFPDNKIFVKWKCEKFHANAFFGIKSTNRKILMGGQSIFRLNEQMKINEIWHSWDMLGLLRQIDWKPQPFKFSDVTDASQIKQKTFYLTAREKECLSLQINGKTARETAQLLFVSPRTIEYYFENIKNKLGCKNKKEVFSAAQSLKKQGLLL